MMGAGKAAHVGSCFGDNYLGYAPVDTGSAIQSVNVGVLLLQQLLQVGVEFGYLSDEESNVGQELFQDEPMVCTQLARESFLQLWNLGSQLALGQLGELLGVALSSKHLGKHLSSRDAGDIGYHTLEFDVSALQGLLQFVSRLASLGRQGTAVPLRRFEWVV